MNFEIFKGFKCTSYKTIGYSRRTCETNTINLINEVKLAYPRSHKFYGHTLAADDLPDSLSAQKCFLEQFTNILFIWF